MNATNRVPIAATVAEETSALGTLFLRKTTLTIVTNATDIKGGTKEKRFMKGTLVLENPANHTVKIIPPVPGKERLTKDELDGILNKKLNAYEQKEGGGFEKFVIEDNGLCYWQRVANVVVTVEEIVTVSITQTQIITVRING